MSISIVRTYPATHKEWDDIWSHCAYATYYHSSGWAELWRHYSKAKIQPSPLVIEFSDGKNALLPLSYAKVKGGIFKIYFSSVPEGNMYGGWISKESMTVHHVLLLVELCKKKYSDILWRLNPYDDAVQSVRISEIYPDNIYALRLDSDMTSIFKKYKITHRRGIKKARNSGVHIRQGNSLKDWRDYYSVYMDSVRRWGTRAQSVHSWELYELLYNMKSKSVKLWLAEKDGKVIAGLIDLFSSKIVTAWQIVVRENYMHVNSTKYLHHRAFQYACDNGHSWYDFGLASRSGLKAFKEGFGAVTLPGGVLRFTSPVLSFLRKGAHAFYKIKKKHV